MSKSSLKNKQPFQVGLTGGIAAGKSTVSKVFQVLGIPVFNADNAGREILNTNTEVQLAIQSLLGNKAIVDGVADRPFIASKVFGSDPLREALNGIIHPAVADAYIDWLEENADSLYVLKESAIAFETGIYKMMNANVLVSAPKEIRLKRTMERDGAKVEEIEKRMEAQWSDEEKVKLADYVIQNDDESAILPQILEIHKNLSGQAASKK